MSKHNVIIVIACAICIILFAIGLSYFTGGFKPQDRNVNGYLITVINPHQIITYTNGDLGRLTAYDNNSTVKLYAKTYETLPNSNGIELREWWTADGIIWNPQHHSGELIITDNYSIEKVTISSLPKNEGDLK